MFQLELLHSKKLRKELYILGFRGEKTKGEIGKQAHRILCDEEELESHLLVSFDERKQVVLALGLVVDRSLMISSLMEPLQQTSVTLTTLW